jgi:hypothetical protein
VILLPDAVSENTKARRIRSVGLFSSSRKSAWLFMKPAALSPFRPTVQIFRHVQHTRPPLYRWGSSSGNLKEVTQMPAFE